MKYKCWKHDSLLVCTRNLVLASSAQNGFSMLSAHCICLIWMCDMLQNSDKGNLAISICEDTDAHSAS